MKPPGPPRGVGALPTSLLDTIPPRTCSRQRLVIAVHDLNRRRSAATARIRISRASSRSADGSQTRSCPYRLGLSLSSHGRQFGGSISRPPQPHSITKDDGVLAQNEVVRNPAYPRACNGIERLRFSQSLTSNLVVLTSILSIFFAVQCKKMPPNPATVRRVHGNAVLDDAAATWCLPAHEHRRPQNPSLVAHLLKVAGAIRFLQSLEAVIAVRRPFRLSCVAFPRQVS
jgi:hypothetical protein